MWGLLLYFSVIVTSENFFVFITFKNNSLLAILDDLAVLKRTFIGVIYCSSTPWSSKLVLGSRMV